MRLSRKLLLGAAVAALAVPATANAALDQIVVTAQKKEENLLDVPISVTAFSGETLRQYGIDSTIDLAFYTPGLTIGQNSGEGDFPFISLRGVTQRDFADTNESPSSVYINEFYKANLNGLDQQVFDMERVEVLRGPQGTLYGRNATGGLIQYITRKPSETFQSSASVLVGERQRIRVEGAVGGPISDAIRGRLSVLHHSFDGYVENAFAGNSDGSALNANAVRGQLAFDVADNLEVSLFGQYYQNDHNEGIMFSHRVVQVDPVTGLAVDNPGGTDIFGYSDSTPSNSRDTDSDRDIAFRNTQTTLIGRIDWSGDLFDFVSITGYEASSKDATFDSDSSPNPRGTEVHPDAEQFSQEFRLSGDVGSLDWLLGFYYFDYTVEGFQQRQTSPAGPRPPVFYDLETESYAVFANLDYQFNDFVGVSLGARFTDEEKEYALDNQDFGIQFNTSTVGDLARLEDDNISFNARVNLRPVENWLVYAGVSRGHKAGTFNVGYTPISPSAIPVQPEQLTSYEVGAKATLFGGDATVSTAAFYYDYEDSQAFQFQDGNATTFNRDAEIYGVELEVAAEPIERLNIFAVATYLDATLLDVELPGPGFGGAGIVDTDAPLAPDWSASFLARYTFDWPWGGDLAVQGDVAYKSSQFFDAFNSPFQEEDAYAVGNARVAWTSETGNLEIAVFAENITDTEYRTYSFDLSFLGLGTDVYGKPRWIGASATYRFGE